MKKKNSQPKFSTNTYFRWEPDHTIDEELRGELPINIDTIDATILFVERKITYYNDFLTKWRKPTTKDFIKAAKINKATQKKLLQALKQLKQVLNTEWLDTWSD